MGAIDEAGDRDPAAPELGARWLDAKGARLAHHDLYALAQVTDQRRIRFGETRKDPLTVALPAVTGPARIEARWNYRRVRPESSLELLGERRPFPVTSIGDGAIDITLP